MSCLYLVVEQSRTSQLRACRGCLATDVRLYDLRQHNQLMDAYYALLSTAVQVTDDLPQYLCSYCAVLLLKCDTFRTNCINKLLLFRQAQIQNIELSLEHIIQIDRPTYFRRSYVQTIDLDVTDTNSNDIDNPEDKNVTAYANEDIKIDPDLETDIFHGIEANFESNIETDCLFKTSETVIVNNSGHTVDFDCLNEDIKDEIETIKDESEVTSDDELSNYSEEEILIPYFENDSKSTDNISDFGQLNQETNCKDVNNALEINPEPKESKTPNVKRTNNSTIKKQTTVKKKRIRVNAKKNLNTEVKNDIKPMEDLDISISNIDNYKNYLKNNRTLLEDKYGKAVVAYYMQRKNTRKDNIINNVSKMFNVDVVELTKEDHLKENEKKKESNIYLQGLFKCNICYRSFVSEETYKRHNRQHGDASGKEVCDICQCHFKNKTQLQKHMVNHKWRYTCRECGNATQYIAKAKQHYLWHKGQKIKCKDCGKEFKGLTSHFTHMKSVHPTSKQLVRCELCGDSFNGPFGLNRHEKRIHVEATSPECLCPGCDTQFYCSAAFKAHQGTDGLCDATHKYCVRCGMAFETEQLLKEHEIEQQKAPEEFKCVECDKTFTNYHYFIAHMKTKKHAKNRYRGAKTKRKYRKATSGSYVCEQCGKMLSSKHCLKLHKDFKHSTKRPFPCTSCQKTFKTAFTLLSHERSHTGERPFECDICQKRFTHNNVARHKLEVHSEVRRFSCDICQKAFVYKSAVQFHIRTVHMKVPTPPRIRRRNKKT